MKESFVSEMMPMIFNIALPTLGFSASSFSLDRNS